MTQAAKIKKHKLIADIFNLKTNFSYLCREIESRIKSRILGYIIRNNNLQKSLGS